MTTKDNLPPVHPGEYIADGIEALNISQSELAAIIGRPRQLVHDIIKGRKGLSTEMCLLLPTVLGSTAEFWSSLQQRYDLKMAAADGNTQRAIEKAVKRFSELRAKTDKKAAARKTRKA